MKLTSFWKIYHANKIFLEYLPLNGNENSHSYLDIPTDNGQSGKSCPYHPWSRRSIGWSGRLLCLGIGVQILQESFYKFVS
jgi:hypothetical protein